MLSPSFGCQDLADERDSLRDHVLSENMLYLRTQQDAAILDLVVPGEMSTHVPNTL